MDEKTNAKSTDPHRPKPSGRVVGLDCHPDSFTAALVSGKTPMEAVVEKVFNKVPIAQLQSWAQKHTTCDDQTVLEASGNSFVVVRRLRKVERQAKVLESAHLGRLKEAHANNDKISAVRMALAYLAGTTKEVWVPDSKTQERRDWMHGHRKAVKRTTQLTNRIQSYLSDNGVRLEGRLTDPDPEQFCAKLAQTNHWSPRQQQVLRIYVSDLRHAQQQREQWVSLMAQEVLSDPLMLSLVRLCGIRDIVAFSVLAVVGDINRFASPKKLVKYIGLNPAFDDSGEEQWSGGIAGHGRKDLRSLLMESAQSIMRTQHPLGQWGRKLLARKSAPNLAVAAVARKLLVAIWYLLMGKWTTLEEITKQLELKISKIISHVGRPAMKAMGKTRAELRLLACQNIKTGRILFMIDPDRKFTPKLPDTPPAAAAAAVCPRCGCKAPPATKSNSKLRATRTTQAPR